MDNGWWMVIAGSWVGIEWEVFKKIRIMGLSSLFM